MGDQVPGLGRHRTNPVQHYGLVTGLGFMPEDPGEDTPIADRFGEMGIEGTCFNQTLSVTKSNDSIIPL